MYLIFFFFKVQITKGMCETKLDDKEHQSFYLTSNSHFKCNEDDNCLKSPPSGAYKKVETSNIICTQIRIHMKDCNIFQKSILWFFFFS